MNSRLFDRPLAGHMLHPWLGRAVRGYFERPFSRHDRLRVSIFYTSNRIAFSQVYPFLHYRQDFAERHNAEIRCLPIERLLAGEPGSLAVADVILVQPWFTVDPAQLADGLARLREVSPDAVVVFLDCYAHNDLRLGMHVAPYVNHYVKKSLFHDRLLYLRSWKGDTNLTEYYGDLYGIEAEPIDWQTPPSLLERLHTGPNFFTDPRFFPAFLNGKLLQSAARAIDVHGRMGSKGSAWYQAMRESSLKQLNGLSDLTIASKGRIPLREFMHELGQSKLCFSPFGYGELCWRDIEAMQVGSVLIKPDMSHLETMPHLYEAGVTYLPVQWDFADLEEVVRSALADDARCRTIAAEAWNRVSSYLRNKRFISDMAFIFDR